MGLPKRLVGKCSSATTEVVHKICQSVETTATLYASVPEEVERNFVANDQPGNVSAELEGVAASSIGKAILDLIGLVSTALGNGSVYAKSRQAADPLDGDAKAGERVEGIGQSFSRGGKLEVKVAERRAKFVDRTWIEDVGVSSHHVL